MVKKEPSAPPELYPDLSNTEDDSARKYRLKQISEIRDFLEKEAESRGRLRRRYKSIYNTSYYVNTASGITAIGASTAAAISITTGVGIIASLPLGIVAITTGVISVASSAFCKTILRKVEKHEKIKNYAMAKLSSVCGLVSRALRDGQISDEEFQVILQEMESYREHKSQIRKKIRAELSTEREEEIRRDSEKKEF